MTVNSSSVFGLSTHQNIGIYGGIVAFTVFVVTMRAVLCYLVILAASRSIHNKMLTAVLRTPVLFFDTNPVGEYSFIATYCKSPFCIQNYYIVFVYKDIYCLACIVYLHLLFYWVHMLFFCGISMKTANFFYT